MSKNILESIIEAQKAMNIKQGGQGNVPSVKEVTAALEGKEQITAAEFRALMSGGIQATAKATEEIVEVAKEIKDVTDIVVEKKASGSQAEKEREQAAIDKEQVEVLKKIEENTRGGGAIESVLPDKNPEPSGGLLSGLGGLLGGLGGSMLGAAGAGGIVGGIAGLFKVGLLGILKKTIAGLLVVSLSKGFIDGFREWKESGDLKEALIKGLGSFLEVISFGMFDEDTIRSIAKMMSDFWKSFETGWENLLIRLGRKEGTIVTEDDNGRSFETPRAKEGEAGAGFNKRGALIEHVKDENGKTVTEKGPEGVKAKTKQTPVNITGEFVVDRSYIDGGRYYLQIEGQEKIQVNKATYDRVDQDLQNGLFNSAVDAIKKYNPENTPKPNPMLSIPVTPDDMSVDLLGNQVPTSDKLSQSQKELSELKEQNTTNNNNPSVTVAAPSNTQISNNTYTQPTSIRNYDDPGYQYSISYQGP